MENLNTYKLPAVVAAGAGLLVASQLVAQAESAPAVVRPLAPVTHDEAEPVTQHSEFDRPHPRTVVAPSQLTTPAKAPTVTHEPKPVSRPSDIAVPSPSGAGNDYWFGLRSYFHGMEYKQAHSNPRALANAKLLAAIATAQGLDHEQIGCADNVFYRESGFDATEYNPNGGAFGIPQAQPGDKMASAGPDWHDNPATQITWGLHYMKRTYGSPCGAWQFWQGHSWY